MVTLADVQPILNKVTEYISVSNIVAVLAAVTAGAIALVFLWWGIRKVVRMLMSAFRKGRLSV